MIFSPPYGCSFHNAIQAKNRQMHMSYERYSLRIMPDKPRVIRVFFRCFVSGRLQKESEDPPCLRRSSAGDNPPSFRTSLFSEVLFSDIKAADIADFAVNDGHFPVIPFLQPEKERKCRFI